MQPPRQHSRINLTELKAQIVHKLGPEGSKQYFYYLNRFLSLKLNKVEFDNLCLKIFGRENIPLHNHFIRSILKNASTSKTTPPSTRDGLSKPGAQIIGKDTTSSHHHLPNGSHMTMTQPSGSPGFTNGGEMLLPISPKKARTGLRDRKGGDRRSTLGPNGKTNFVPQPPSDFNVVPENGVLQKSDNGEDKISSPHGPNSPITRTCSEPTSPIRAPLGVPFCPVSAGRARRAPAGHDGCMASFVNDGILWDSATLRERMEHIALAEGLEGGVSLDSANILNQGLDSYMKLLIRPCIELVGQTQLREATESSNVNKHRGCPKPVNGIRPGYENLLQNSGKHLEVEEPRNGRRISLHDFKVAMEMNPRNLGEDWPISMEKICVNAFEE